MATNKNIVRVEFDGQAMGDPRNYRIACEYQSIEDSAGTDTFITSHDATRGRVAIQVAFADHDDALSMVTTKWGNEGTLTLETQTLGTDTTKTVTIVTARCLGVIMDAQHGDPGTHIATFVARSAGGTAKPIS